MPSESGGTRSYEFARRLSAAGYDVQIVTSDTRSNAPRGWRTEVVDGFTVHWLGVPYANKMSYFRRIVAFFSFALRSSKRARSLRGDVIYATSVPLTIVIPALWAALFRRTPILFEVRDLWPEMPIAVGALRNPILIFMARLLELVAYRTAAHIIALSPGMRDGVLARGIPADRVTVIPNGADLDLFGGDGVKPKDWTDDCPGLVGKKLVVYCGTLGHLNGLSYLAETAAELSHLRDDVAFLVVGNGKEDEIVQERAFELGVLGTSFYMMPAIPKVQVPAIYAAADIVTSVFLPIKEMEVNSANKFFDALAAGKPVAINYGGWQADIVNSSRIGVVLPASDTKKAALILSYLLDNPKELQQMSKRSREVAEKEFDRDILSERLLTVVEKLSKSKAS